MSPDARDRTYLADMLQHAREVVAFVDGVSLERYERDSLVRYAVERGIEIVGEAANHVSPETQALHPEIRWRAIIAQRHVLAHGYNAIVDERIWRVATIELPVLIAQLAPLVPDIPTPPPQDHA